jgi:hemerythrin
MQLLEWSSALSVNVGSIDHEHQALVGMINELHAAMLERSSREVLDGILSRLTSYTKGHFGHEERIMRELSYAGYQQHKDEHDGFCNKVSEFRQGFREGRLMLSTELVHFLRDWLKSHIQGTDRQYTEYFNQHGYR